MDFNRSSDPQKFGQRAKGALRLHTGVQEALRALLRSSEDRCAYIRAAVDENARWSTLQRNFICGLPNELLRRIFQFSETKNAHECSGPRVGFSLSHTCGRFRDIALTIPRLWSSLADDQSPEEIKEYLTRAKTSTLFITVGKRARNSSSKKILAFLQSVLPLSDRWVSFTLDVPWGGSYAIDEEEDLYDIPFASLFIDLAKSCKGLTLASLEKLDLFYPHPKVFEDIEEHGPVFRNVEHFYASWTMPKLHTLFVEEIVPRPLLAPVLSTCTIVFEDDDYCHEFGKKLRMFLEKSPSLKHFDVSFDPRYDRPSDMPFTGRSIALPSLESLSICASSKVSKGLIRLLDVPQLSSLSLGVCFKYNEEFPDDWINDALRPGRQYSSITHLRLVTHRRDSPEYDDSPLPSVFQAFSNVQHLSLQMPGVNLSGDLPCIRSLRLTDCDRMSSYALESLLKGLRGNSAQDRFELLSVRGCSQLQKEKLLEFLPREKIQWMPTV